MNNLVKIEPEFVTIKTVNRYGTEDKISVSFYPYNSNYWQETVKRFNISLPSTVITLADGFSVCQHCGARYAGKQFLCERKIFFYETSGYSWGNDRKKRGNFFVGDIDPKNYVEKVTRSYEAPCHSVNVEWDLQKEFDFQSKFFSFLDSLSSISEYSNSSLEEFKDYIPHGKYDIIDFNIMRNRISCLEMQNQMLISAIKQIAERMSVAGVALNIGNL